MLIHFQKFQILIFGIGEIDMAYLVNPKTSLFRLTTPEAATTGASVPPMGRELENPSWTSGGQTVTLVKS